MIQVTKIITNKACENTGIVYIPPHLPVLDPCPVPDDNRESTKVHERHAAFRNGRRICRYMTAIRAALHCKETATSSRCLICAHRHDVGQSGYSTIDHGGSAETLGNDHPAVFDNLEGHVEPAGDMVGTPPYMASAVRYPTRSASFNAVSRLVRCSMRVPSHPPSSPRLLFLAGAGGSCKRYIVSLYLL